MTTPSGITVQGVLHLSPSTNEVSVSLSAHTHLGTNDYSRDQTTVEAVEDGRGTMHPVKRGNVWSEVCSGVKFRQDQISQDHWVARLQVDPEACPVFLCMVNRSVYSCNDSEFNRCDEHVFAYRIDPAASPDGDLRPPEAPATSTRAARTHSARHTAIPAWKCTLKEDCQLTDDGLIHLKGLGRPARHLDKDQ